MRVQHEERVLQAADDGGRLQDDQEDQNMMTQLGSNKSSINGKKRFFIPFYFFLLFLLSYIFSYSLIFGNISIASLFRLCNS